MANTIELKVPDIGGHDNVPVIEVLVKVGDKVEKEQSLITLESDKATMEIPASASGVIKELKLKVGDEVSEGAVIAVLEASDGASAPSPSPQRAEGRGEGSTSSSASASFTSDRSYHMASSIALNNASGGHAGSPLTDEETTANRRSIGTQSTKSRRSSNAQWRPTSDLPNANAS